MDDAAGQARAAVNRVLGVDTGSRWCAATLAERASPDAPPTILDARTLDVNPTGIRGPDIDVAPVVAWLLERAASAERIIVEHSDSWAPWAGAHPAALQRSAENWAVCDRIVRELRRVSATLASPLPVETLHVNSIRARIIPSDIRKAEGKADAKVAASLVRLLSPACLSRLNAVVPPCRDPRHQRDAAAAAIAWLTGPAEPAARGPRAPGPPRAGKSAAWVARRAAKALAVREAAGCKCGHNHVWECALYKRDRGPLGPARPAEAKVAREEKRARQAAAAARYVPTTR